MIKNIILDFGMVLANFCWEKHMKSFGYTGETFERIAKATVLSPDWVEYDRGVLTDEEILNRFIAHEPSVKAEICRVLENLNGMIEIYPYTKSWMQELKAQGYQVYILSNLGSKVFHDCGSKMDFVELADGAVFSYQEKLVKPDDSIYYRILKRYQLRPEETVFFDDNKANIEAACEVGIHGIVFEALEQAKQELEAVVKKEKFG